MANIFPITDFNDTRRQFKEILIKGIDASNLKKDTNILKNKALLEDRSTGDIYRLYVKDGNLNIEQI